MPEKDCPFVSHFDRIVILGNTASGKSWLSKKLGAVLSSRVVDLDQIRWIDGDYSRRETKQIAVAKTIEEAKHDRWIIEGVYGWLISPILGRATCLVWTDIPWSESRENLLARETARGASGNFSELETWSSAYWDRDSASSFKAHVRLYEGFTGPKYRLNNMIETSDFADRIELVVMR